MEAAADRKYKKESQKEKIGAEIGTHIAVLDPSSQASKSALLSLARHTQFAPDERLLRAAAGPLTETVLEALGPLWPLFILTEPGRRAVFCAVLARLAADDRLKEWPRDKLLGYLLLESDRALLGHAYGCSSKPFAKLVRLAAPHSEDFYDRLAAIASTPGLPPLLVQHLQQRPLTAEVAEIVLKLPPTPEGVKAAMALLEVDFRAWYKAYYMITGEAAVQEQHLNRLARGEAPARLLEALVREKPFPSGPELGQPFIFASCGNHLAAWAQEFSNCLAEPQHACAALAGAAQYYRIDLHMPDTTATMPVALKIERDAFGWVLVEAKRARNRRLPRPLREALERLLKAQGVRVDARADRMLSTFFADDDDFFLIDDLFNDAA